MGDYQKSFTVLAEELRSPPFSLLSFGKFLNHLQQISLGFHCCSRCGLVRRTSTGIWESGWEQVAADQQALDFSSSKSKFNLFL